MTKDIREQLIAKQEAQTAHDSDAFFDARRNYERPKNRWLFEEGHQRGYQSRQPEIDALKARIAELEASGLT